MGSWSKVLLLRDSWIFSSLKVLRRVDSSFLTRFSNSYKLNIFIKPIIIILNKMHVL